MTDWAAKNRDHHNNSASTYNSKFSKILLQITEEIQARRDWIGVDWVQKSDEDSSNPQKSVRLLDYACGTGLVSRALALYISHALGIDVSSSMVQEYHTSAAKQGIPESKMHAVVGNLIDVSSPPDPSFSAPEFHNFDIAAVGMGWHHFPDPAFAAKQLALRLKVGGTLLIIDFLPHGAAGDGHGHGQGHHHGEGEGKAYREKADGDGEDKKMETAARQTITHMGFAEGDIKKMFEEAGVGVDFDFVVLEKEIVFESEGQSMSRTAFMARGRKR